MELLEKIKGLAQKEADKLKLSVYNVYFEGNGKDKILHIELDKKGGISLIDVTQFTELINPILDSMEELDFTYNLDCSSLGAERFIPLEEVDSHLGEYMEVSTKDKKILGTLESLSPEAVVIKSFIKGRPHKDTINRGDLNKIQLRIKF